MAYSPGSKTSKVTGRHRGPKCKRTFVCRNVATPGECYYTTLLCCHPECHPVLGAAHYYVAISFHRRVWYCTLSLGYVCI